MNKLKELHDKIFSSIQKLFLRLLKSIDPY
jgi:hypothetical protein